MPPVRKVKIIKKVSKKKEPAPLPEVIAKELKQQKGSQGDQESKKVKKVKKEKTVDPLIIRRPKNFTIGNDIPPKRDMTRFVKWPLYIRLQRRRATLMRRLKIPPPINQFRRNLLKRQGCVQLFRFLDRYRPETRQAKKERLRKMAKAKASGKNPPPQKRPPVIIHGANKVTTLVEKKKALLVAIAADTEPLELVIHLPALCRKLGVPYCIIRGGRSRLGMLARRRSVSVICITDVLPEDKPALVKLQELLKSSFNDRYDDIRRQWGGGQLSKRSQAKKQKLERAKQREQKSKPLASVLAKRAAKADKVAPAV